MEFKINKEKELLPPKGFSEEPIHENNSKAELLEILNIALDRFEEKDSVLYSELTGVTETCVENGNKCIEIIETEKEICISIYNLEKRWIKTKG